MNYEKALSVSELTSQLKGMIESSYSSVIVRGEISNFTHHSSGHMYFTLKDKYSELKSVMFKGSNNALPFSPKSGDDVIVQGKFYLMATLYYVLFYRLFSLQLLP